MFIPYLFTGLLMLTTIGMIYNNMRYSAAFDENKQAQITQNADLYMISEKKITKYANQSAILLVIESIILIAALISIIVVQN